MSAPVPGRSASMSSSSNGYSPSSSTFDAHRPENVPGLPLLRLYFRHDVFRDRGAPQREPDRLINPEDAAEDNHLVSRQRSSATRKARSSPPPARTAPARRQPFRAGSRSCSGGAAAPTRPRQRALPRSPSAGQSLPIPMSSSASPSIVHARADQHQPRVPAASAIIAAGSCELCHVLASRAESPRRVGRETIPGKQTVSMRDFPSGTVTFLFTDVEGSTRRWEQDSAAMRAAIERHFAILDEAIRAQQWRPLQDHRRCRSGRLSHGARRGAGRGCRPARPDRRRLGRARSDPGPHGAAHRRRDTARRRLPLSRAQSPRPAPGRRRRWSDSADRSHPATGAGPLPRRDAPPARRSWRASIARPERSRACLSAHRPRSSLGLSAAQESGPANP